MALLPREATLMPFSHETQWVTSPSDLPHKGGVEIVEKRRNTNATLKYIVQGNNKVRTQTQQEQRSAQNPGNTQRGPALRSITVKLK